MTAMTKTAPQAVAVRDLDDAGSFSGLVAMGDQLVRTGFLPEHCRTGVQFAAIVMAGRELGMTPMRAIRSLQMVKGKVVEDAASQLARFKQAGGKAVFLHLDENKAVLKLTHPNGDEHTETWTRDDAKAAGLSGGMHSKFPKAMNRSRVITSGLKSLGWEGAVGAYDPEELDVPAIRTVQAGEPTEVTPAPAAPAGPSMSRVLDLAQAIVDANTADDISEAFRAIDDVTGGNEKLARRLEALVSQRSAQLADVEWDADDMKKAAAKWLRDELQKRNGNG